MLVRHNGTKRRRTSALCHGVGLLLALGGCGGPGAEPTRTQAPAVTAQTRDANVDVASERAKAVMTALRARLFAVTDDAEPVSGADAVLPRGIAERFETEAGGLSPRFAASVAAAPARVRFPLRSTAPVRLEDVASNVAVDVDVVDAREASAATTDGYVVYERAHATGATLLHRARPDGLEDFVSFESRPATPSIAYRVRLSNGIKGLRLVSNTLEFLDGNGAPRLRVSPPFLIGADGERTDAELSVDGCAVDLNPAPPWGRPVTAPGGETCTLRVSWTDHSVAYPALLDPVWSTTGSMAQARQDHTATVLSSGRVLVAGGRASGSSTTGLATAELFDRATGTWAATANMTGGRFSHSAVQLGTSSNATTSGKILVAGGLNGSSSLNTAQLYSTAGTWVAAANLNAARHLHTATVLSNGQVLHAGGMNGTTVLNTAARYNPTTGTGSWTATGNMASARRSHTAARLVVSGNATLNNRVLVVGGNSGGTTSLTSVQLFDNTNWSTPSGIQLSTSREGHAAVALANGNVLVTGGKSGASTLNTTLLFNAATGSGSWGNAGNLNSARQLHTASLVPAPSGGQVLVAGGSTNGTNSLDSAELWNGTNSWSLTNTLAVPTRAHTATVLSGGPLLVAAGVNASTTHAVSQLFALTCTSNGQCASGFCADGVCCDQACTGNTCRACNMAGLVGTCSPKPSGTICVDGNACTLTDTCQAGACTGSNPVVCTASDQCHAAGTCNTTTGLCSNPERTGSCEDGNECTQNDSCQSGSCVGGSGPALDDNNPCTVDSCDSAAGVTHTPVAEFTACPDANLCDGLEVCRAGVCTDEAPGATSTCAAGTHVTFYQSFDGGTTVDIAASGVRTPTTNETLIKSPGLFGEGIDGSTNPWIEYHTDWYTNPASMVLSKPGSVSLWMKLRSDYSPATFFIGLDSNSYLIAGDDGAGLWVRMSGGPVGSTNASAYMARPPTWVSGEAWHLIVINWSPAGVELVVNGVSTGVASAPWMATPHNGATVNNWIVAGGSGSGNTRDELLILDRPLSRDDILWYYAQRLNPPNVNPALERFGTDPVGCNAQDDLNPCTADSCDPVLGAVHTALADGSTCSDGFACTQNDTCQAGVCISGPALGVDDGNPCTDDWCNVWLGGELHTSHADGTSCSDGNKCNGDEVCQGGSCQGGQPVTCVATDECHAAGVCDPLIGKCTNPSLADGTPCNDENQCTSTDTCNNGHCGGPNSCVPNGRFAQIEDLGVLYVGSASAGYGINDSGDVVAADTGSGGFEVAWRFTDAAGPQPITFGTPGAASRGNAINSAGLIAGVMSVSTPMRDLYGYQYETFGFVGEPGSEPTIVTALSGGAVDVNDEGEVAIIEPWADGGPGYMGAFRWSAGTKQSVGRFADPRFTGGMIPTAIGPGPGGAIVGEARVNSEGWLGDSRFTIGWGVREAFVFDASGLYSINDDPRVHAAGWQLVYSALATNGTHTTGWGVINDRCRAFRYTREGGIVDIGAYPGLNGDPDTNQAVCIQGGRVVRTAGEGINDAGDIVGTGYTSYPVGGFYYSDETNLIDLQTLVDPSLNYFIVTANAINNERQIVGRMAVGHPNGPRHAFRMTLPERLTEPGGCVAQAPGDCIITPRFEGLATIGETTHAVFSYANRTGETVHIPHGPDNSLTYENGSTPPVAAPEWLLSGDHPGALVVPMVTNSLTWTIRNFSATATVGGQPLPTLDTPRGRTATLSDGSPVFLEFNPAYGTVATDTIETGLTVGKTAGEFAVTADGASSYKIPLWVSPGRGGFAPSLALSYNSRGGPGHLGVGWTLGGVSQITRCDKNVATDQVASAPQFAAGDALCLDGKRLLLVSGSGGDGSEYWEMETSFSRVIQHGALNTSVTFEVKRRDGSVATYGGGDATVNPPALLPTLPRHELAWSIANERDLAGNMIRYVYVQSNTTDTDPLLQGKPEYLLNRIDYVFAGASQTTPTRFVLFTYEPLVKQHHRLQWQVPLPLRSRVKSILVIGPNPAGPGVLREYRLGYTTGTLSGRDLLASVTECDGPPGVCKRPTKFHYSDDPSPQYELHAGTFPETRHEMTRDCCFNGDGTCCSIGTTSQRSDAIVVDLNGDGLDDVIYAFHDYMVRSADFGTTLPGTSHFVCRLSDGHGLGPEIDLTNKLVANATLPLYVADLNGDGKTDVLAAVGTPSFGAASYYAFQSTTARTTPAGGASPDVQFARSSAPLLEVQTDISALAVFKSRPYFADMDGDGLVDMLQGIAPMDPNNSQRRLAMDWQVWRGQADGSFGAPIHALTSLSGYVQHPTQFEHETVIAARTKQQAGMQFLVPTQAHLIDNGDGSVTGTNDLSSVTMDFHGAVSVSNPNLSDDAMFAPFMLDLNGDGLPEVVKVMAFTHGTCNQTQQGCIETQLEFPIFIDRNIGGGFLPDQNTGIDTHWARSGRNAWHTDYNQDGADDLVLVHELRDTAISGDYGANKVGVLESNQVGLNPPHPLFSGGTGSSNRIGGLWYEVATIYSVGQGGVVPFRAGKVHPALPFDVNGDGLTDVVLGPNVYVRQGGRVDLLTGIVDGVGHDVLVKYRSLGDRDPIDPRNEIPSSQQIPFYSHTEECSYPRYGTNKGVWAVAEVAIDDGLSFRDEDPANCSACGKAGSGTYNRFLYAYENGRSSVTNGEWLGFTKRTTIDVTRGMTTVTTYDTTSMVGSDLFWGRFKPKSEEVTIDLPAHDLAMHPNEAIQYRKRTDTEYTVKAAFGSRSDIVAVLPGRIVVDETDTGSSVKTIRHIERTFLYDDYGNVTTETEAYGGSEAHQRGTDYENRTSGSQWLLGLATHVTTTSTPINGETPVTRTTDYTYDATGQLETETIEPDGDESLLLETVFERDAFGNVTAVTTSDSQGATRRTEYTYDSDSVYRTRERNALGHVSQTVYHSGYGLPVFAIDPNGALEASRYDRFGRLKAKEHADGSSESVIYARGLTVTTTTSDNHLASSTFDRLGRVVQDQVRAFDGRLASATKSYNRLGQLVSSTLPAFAGEQPRSTSTFAYDQRDRLTMKRISDNQTPFVADSFNFYDGLDELNVDPIVLTDVGIIRPVRRVTKDDRGRPIRVVDYKDATESAGVTMMYTYGAFGVARTIQTAWPTGPTREAFYDQRGRVVARSDMDSGETYIGFNAWGEETSVTDAEEQTTTSDRDALGRVFAQHSPLGESTFNWDRAPFGVGRLASSSSEGGAGASEIERVYDVAGHVLRESYRVHGESLVIDYAYHQTGPQIGKLAVVTYPPIPGRTDPVMVETRYGANGDVSALAQAGSGATYFQVVRKDASSRVTEELFGSDVRRTRGYDPLFGALATARAERQGTILQNLTTGYDYRGNVVSRVDTAPGLGTQGVAETFDYDALSRLRYWTSNTGAFSVEYRYDDLGNLTQRQLTRDGVVATPEVYRYGESGAGPHQLTTAPWGTYDYDANGDQIQAPGRTAEFAPFHLPLSVTTASQAVQFEYDALHQRTFKSASGTTTTYAGTEYERREDAQGTHHVVHLRFDGREVAELQIDDNNPTVSPRATYLLDDHLGSPVVIVDSSGTVTRPRYEPFGHRLADGDVPSSGNSGNPVVHFGITGHEYDDELGLINMRGRMYDPRIRRFLSPDPVVDSPLSGQAYNRYSYVANNPMSRTDPTGFAGTSVNAQSAQSGAPGRAETGDPTAISMRPGASDGFSSTGAQVNHGSTTGALQVGSGRCVSVCTLEADDFHDVPGWPTQRTFTNEPTISPRNYNATSRIRKDVDPIRVKNTSGVYVGGEKLLLFGFSGVVTGPLSAPFKGEVGKMLLQAGMRALHATAGELYSGLPSGTGRTELALNILVSAGYAVIDPTAGDGAIMKGAFDEVFKTAVKGFANKLVFDRDLELRNLLMNGATGGLKGLGGAPRMFRDVESAKPGAWRAR
jgi:RHS repeat-associated protein